MSVWDPLRNYPGEFGSPDRGANRFFGEGGRRPKHAEVGRIDKTIESGAQRGYRYSSSDWIRMFARKKQHVDRKIKALELGHLRWLVEQGCNVQEFKIPRWSEGGDKQVVLGRDTALVYTRLQVWRRIQRWALVSGDAADSKLCRGTVVLPLVGWRCGVLADAVQLVLLRKRRRAVLSKDPGDRSVARPLLLKKFQGFDFSKHPGTRPLVKETNAQRILKQRDIGTKRLRDGNVRFARLVELNGRSCTILVFFNRTPNEE